MAGKQKSAGILAVRGSGPALEFFLVHPGGPIWANKDEGAWTIPKGLIDAEEDALACAKRELAEETGFAIPEGSYVSLGAVTQKSGKIVEAWAVRADFDASKLVSNTFTMEWPPRSGKRGEFPEVDRGGWFSYEEACAKINPAQVALLDRAREAVLRIP
jgi:predicted NUDIX family NTP pyrophosphohydrolase